MESTTQVIAKPNLDKARGACVVIDVLRASSVEAHLFECKALKIIPQSDINETLKQDPRVNFLINESSVLPIPEKKAFAITIIFALIGFSDTKKSLELMLAR